MQDHLSNLSLLLSHETLDYALLDDDKKGPDLLKKYGTKPYEFFTVILTQQSIERMKFENTPFILTEYKTLPSPIRREAYELMERKFRHNFEFVKEIINTYYPKEKTNPQEWYEEYDLYQENPEELNEYKKSLFLPIYEKRYKLNYAAILPHPLGGLSHSCLTKQFYFIKENKKLYVAIGCSCGSATRYVHGLYGHFFTLLQNEGKSIASFATEINEKCQFQIIKKTNHLILYQHDLIGNYAFENNNIEELFKGIELYYPLNG